MKDTDLERDRFLASLPRTWLLCRTKRHKFEDNPLTVTWDPQEQCDRVRDQCERCGTIRLQLWTPSGDIVHTSYSERPEGYLAKGLGQMVSEDYAVMRKQIRAGWTKQRNQARAS